MAVRNLYDVLEIPRGASAAEVRKAYKRLARKYHPDLNPGDSAAEERFKELSEAHAILSDPEQKKRYDTTGTVGPRPGGGPRVDFTGFDFDAGPTSGGFQDLLDAFLHTAQSRENQGPRPGEDLVFPLSLTLQEAFTGKRARIAVRHTVACGGCRGEGRLPHKRSRSCSSCGGSGKVGLSRGPFSFARTCPACGGSGKDPGEPCRACGGAGSAETVETVEVSIPPGVDTGSRVRVKGKGQAGRFGGPPGDLYIETHILDDPTYRREGPNLRVKVPITVTEAVLGARIDVPTLGGGARLKIPPGTSSGQVFRLRERGMPSLRGGTAGDLLVEVTIWTPPVVDERSKDLLREFARLNPENPRPYTGAEKG
ncbi:MAG: molecular chaperone DnaJ [Acidobacteriota bacterium]